MSLVGDRRKHVDGPSQTGPGRAEQAYGVLSDGREFLQTGWVQNSWYGVRPGAARASWAPSCVPPLARLLPTTTG
jgi:hypothetical protein